MLHRRAWFAERRMPRSNSTRTRRVDEHGRNSTATARTVAGRSRTVRVTAGTIRESVAYARKSAGGAKRLVRRTLADGLGLPDDPTIYVTFRDARTGLAYLRSCRDIRERGLWLALDAYQGHAFWEFRELADGVSGQWRRLAERLGGRGVPSLDEALLEVQLEPVHGPRGRSSMAASLPRRMARPIRRPRALEDRLETCSQPSPTRGSRRYGTTRPHTGQASEVDAMGRPPCHARTGTPCSVLVLSRAGAGAGRGRARDEPRWYDELRCGVLAAGFRYEGPRGPEWGVADSSASSARSRDIDSPWRGRRATCVLESWLTRDPGERRWPNTWRASSADRELFTSMSAGRATRASDGRDPDERSGPRRVRPRGGYGSAACLAQRRAIGGPDESEVAETRDR